MDVTITDDPPSHRYVISADGVPAGEIIYGFRHDRRVLKHAGVDTQFKGKGIASAAIAATLDRSRELGERVVPLCPFVAAFISEHPEYDDLVDHDLLAALTHRSP